MAHAAALDDDSRLLQRRMLACHALAGCSRAICNMHRSHIRGSHPVPSVYQHTEQINQHGDIGIINQHGDVGTVASATHRA
jgi:hypothetical protein